MKSSIMEENCLYSASVTAARRRFAFRLTSLVNSSCTSISQGTALSGKMSISEARFSARRFPLGGETENSRGFTPTETERAGRDNIFCVVRIGLNIASYLFFIHALYSACVNTS